MSFQVIMSLEEILNLRELEREKIEKTAEKIRESIEKDNYRMVQKYKENITKISEKWEGLHLQVASLKKVSTNDSNMKKSHRQVLDLVEKAIEEADIYYNELKIKKKEERKAEKEKNADKARLEQETRDLQKMEERKPFLKELFISEIREINKIVSEYVKKIENKKNNWVPETNALVIELKYLENRYAETIQSYNQLVAFITNPDEISKLREIKNTEERKFRADLMIIKSFVNVLQSGNQQSKVNITLPTRENIKTSQPNFAGEI